MNDFLEEKKRILIDWLLRNNIDIQNTMNAQIGVKDFQQEAIFNATVITSVLLKEKMLGPNFDGLENLLETDAPVIVALRKCDKQHQLLNILNSAEFRDIGTTFCVKNVLEIYDREKEADNIRDNTIDKEFENKENNKFDTVDAYNNGYNNSNFNKTNFTQTGYQNNNVTFENRENSLNQTTNSFNSPIGRNDFDNYNQYTNTENYLHSNNIDSKTAIKEHGLNHVINGVQTITHKLPDGNYSFEMVIPVGYKGETQSVNKKVITKEEHDRFIENYQDEIFDVKKEYSYNKEMTMEFEDDDLVYRPQ